MYILHTSAFNTVMFSKSHSLYRQNRNNKRCVENQHPCTFEVFDDGSSLKDAWRNLVVLFVERGSSNGFHFPSPPHGSYSVDQRAMESCQLISVKNKKQRGTHREL